MTREELTEALCHLKVETGSLACLGCGHEHNCSTHGCAILRQTITDRDNDQRCMEALRKQVVDLTQASVLCAGEVEKLAAENTALKADLKSCLVENCDFCAHHEDADAYDCDCECLTCKDERCICRTCQDGSRFEWIRPRKES